MHISRIVIRNFRNFKKADIRFRDGVTCVIGENNTGKSNLLFGLRLALDVNLSSFHRTLTSADIHSGTALNTPLQALIAVEFSDYSESDKEKAMVGGWECESNEVARVYYRFRPRPSIVEQYNQDPTRPLNLTEGDFHWTITGGGDKDPLEVEWYEQAGISITFTQLEVFHILSLQAQRDVITDLTQQRSSPLRRIMKIIDKQPDEEESILRILKNANDQIATKPSIVSASEAINSAYTTTAGDAHQLDIGLGMAEPNTGNVAKSLALSLSHGGLKDFNVERNGLGINNVLYTSMVLEYFKRRSSKSEIAGQLLLIEEPEAHLHPQLQRTLYTSLAKHGFQTLITTHSPYITSLSPLNSYVILTQMGSHTTVASPITNAGLEDSEIRDLERYLDATRSPLLFARKVILVEGPAEQFLIPALLKSVLNFDIDSQGISIIPIFGKHFSIYCKLLSGHTMAKKCVVLGDLDKSPEDADDEDAVYELDEIEPLQTDFLQCYGCETTFERALVVPGTIKMIAAAAKELNKRDLLRMARSYLEHPDDEDMDPIRAAMLAAAKDVGKARFAQVLASHAKKATDLPQYIKDAISWLRK